MGLTDPRLNRRRQHNDAALLRNHHSSVTGACGNHSRVDDDKARVSFAEPISSPPLYLGFDSARMRGKGVALG